MDEPGKMKLIRYRAKDMRKDEPFEQDGKERDFKRRLDNLLAEMDSRCATRVNAKFDPADRCFLPPRRIQRRGGLHAAYAVAVQHPSGCKQPRKLPPA